MSALRSSLQHGHGFDQPVPGRILAPDRSHPVTRDGIGRSAGRSARHHAPHHGGAAPAGHRQNRSDRTCTRPRTGERWPVATAGRSRSSPTSPGCAPATARRSGEHHWSTRSLAQLAQATAPGTEQVMLEAGVVTPGCRWQRPDDHVARGFHLEQVASEMTQPALDQVADDRIAHGSGHNKTHPGDATVITTGMDDQGGASGSHASANRRLEISRRGQPMASRQHCWVRPTVRRDPCGGGQPGWRVRHESACGRGSRGYGCDAGCWAGRCAWSRQSPFDDSLRATMTMAWEGRRQMATKQRYARIRVASNFPSERTQHPSKLHRCSPDDTPPRMNNLATRCCIRPGPSTTVHGTTGATEPGLSTETPTCG